MIDVVPSYHFYNYLSSEYNGAQIRRKKNYLIIFFFDIYIMTCTYHKSRVKTWHQYNVLIY